MHRNNLGQNLDDVAMCLGGAQGERPRIQQKTAGEASRRPCFSELGLEGRGGKREGPSKGKNTFCTILGCVSSLRAEHQRVS